MSVTFNQTKNGVFVIQGETNMGRLADVLNNHASLIVDEQQKEGGKPNETLPHQAALAIEQHITDTIAAAEQRADEAETRADESIAAAKQEAEQHKQRADELEQYRPATDDEIEREAKAKANRIRRERAIDARAHEIADAE